MSFLSTPPQKKEDYLLFFDFLEQHNYINGSNNLWQNNFKLRSKPFFAETYIKLESESLHLTFINNFELNLRVGLINYFACTKKNLKLSHITLNNKIQKRTNRILFCLNNEPASLKEINIRSIKDENFDLIFETVETEPKYQGLNEVPQITLSSYKNVILDLLPLFMDYKLKSKNFRSFINPSLEKKEEKISHLKTMLNFEIYNIFIHYAIIEAIIDIEIILKSVLI